MPDIPLDTLVIIGLVLASLIGRIFQKKQDPKKSADKPPSSQASGSKPSIDEILKKAFGQTEILVEDEYDESITSSQPVPFEQTEQTNLTTSSIPRSSPAPSSSRKIEKVPLLFESPSRTAREELFSSRDSLRKAFILKEILDKPVSLRNNH